MTIRHFVVRYGAYISLALLLAIAFFITPEIYSRNTLFLILRQASQLGLVAIGQTLVMLVAGLDSVRYRRDRNDIGHYCRGGCGPG